MITIIRLIISILLPVIASAIIYLLDKKTVFHKIHDRNKQIIIGIVFGLIGMYIGKIEALSVKNVSTENYENNK